MFFVRHPGLYIFAKMVDHIAHPLIPALKDHFYALSHIHPELPVHVFLHAEPVFRKYGRLLRDLRMTDAVNPKVNNEWLRMFFRMSNHIVMIIVPHHGDRAQVVVLPLISKDFFLCRQIVIILEPDLPSRIYGVRDYVNGIVDLLIIRLEYIRCVYMTDEGLRLRSAHELRQLSNQGIAFLLRNKTRGGDCIDEHLNFRHFENAARHIICIPVSLRRNYIEPFRRKNLYIIFDGLTVSICSVVCEQLYQFLVRHWVLLVRKSIQVLQDPQNALFVLL